MKRRRRVSLRESFKLAGGGTMNADDASFLAMITLGVWWWIAGVPEAAVEGSPEEESPGPE